MRPRYLSTRIRRALTIWVSELAIESAWPLLALRLGFRAPSVMRESSPKGRSVGPRPFLYSPLFTNVVEVEFSEVHGSKLPWSGWPLGLWGGAMRPSTTLYLQGSPPMWQGIVASDYDLLRPRLPRIPLLGTSVNRPFGFASHGDDDFSSSVSCFQIPHGLGDLAQWVSPVDNRCDLPRFGELLED